MDMKQLEHFVQAVKAGSLSAAACSERQRVRKCKAQCTSSCGTRLGKSGTNFEVGDAEMAKQLWFARYF